MSKVQLVIGEQASDAVMNERLSAALTTTKIPHEVKRLPGGHTFPVVQAGLGPVLDFVRRHIASLRTGSRRWLWKIMRTGSQTGLRSPPYIFAGLEHQTFGRMILTLVSHFMFFRWHYRTLVMFLTRCGALTSLLCVAAVFAAGTKEPDDATWSAESHGLRARLVMRRMSVFNGTAMIATYLELKNVSVVGSPLMLKSHPLKFTVTDSDGHDVPMTGGNYDGFSFDTPPLVLPHDSQIKFRIGPTGWGVPADQAALLDLGPEFGRVLPRDGKAYYLQATMTLAQEKNDRSGSATVWHGTLDLPRVRIPTEPDAIDPKTIGPRIDELGAKLLDSLFDVSDAAAKELSLINDPRVIPWYIKAVKSNSYDLRFVALDRLGRMDGDEALAGLKIGMITSGADMGHCSTPQAADSLAVNIRAAAAHALARSPHPDAKALLWTMEKDASNSVRLTVIHTAAKADTPEALAILQRGTQDADKMVRDEAKRLLRERQKSK